jgi:hypothetical protein
VTFRPNPRFEEQLAADPAVIRVLQGKADEALTAAQTISQGFSDDGEYPDSLDAGDASLSTSHPAGHIIEWGSEDTPPLAPLRKAVEQVGATYKDDRG